MPRESLSFRELKPESKDDWRIVLRWCKLLRTLPRSALLDWINRIEQEVSMGYVNVDVGPNGEVRVSVEGVPGKKCHEVSLPFEQLLGTVSSSSDTPDLQQKEQAREQRKERA